VTHFSASPESGRLLQSGVQPFGSGLVNGKQLPRKAGFLLLFSDPKADAILTRNHVLILVPVFFALIKERALRLATSRHSQATTEAEV
jgi:hypothetical protein